MSYFNHFADSPSTKFGNWITQKTIQGEFKYLRSFLTNKQSAILEIGPGMGEMARQFIQVGYTNYTVVEPNARMRERLGTAGIKVKNYLIPHLSETDGTYDAILLFDVFEHLNDTREAGVFLSESWRVLRPGGWLCLAAPDYLHWRDDFYNCDYTHSNVTTVRRAIQLLHNQGFSVHGYHYLSGFFRGELASIISNMVRMGLFFANSNGIDQKLYKLKLTFLRRFIIIGRRKE